jgi:citrate lyase subunit beta/citryl-CoA lyase
MPLAAPDSLSLSHVVSLYPLQGFDGKTLIHPSQVEACNRAFSPSPDDVAWARMVVEAAAAQEAAAPRSSGDSVLVLVDGQLIERLHVAEARRVLQLHDAIEARSATLPLAGASIAKA